MSIKKPPPSGVASLVINAPKRIWHISQVHDQILSWVLSPGDMGSFHKRERLEVTESLDKKSRDGIIEERGAYLYYT